MSSRRGLAVTAAAISAVTVFAPSAAYAGSPSHTSTEARPGVSSTAIKASAKADAPPIKTTSSKSSSTVGKGVSGNSRSLAGDRFLAARPQTSSGKVIYVAVPVAVSAPACMPAGETGNGTQAKPFCNLQDGIDAASPGDTVVAAGQLGYSFADDVQVTTSNISIIGTNNVTSIDGNGMPDFVLNGVTGVTISGFTLQTDAGAGVPAVQIEGSSGITLDSNYVQTYYPSAVGAFAVNGSSSGVTISRNIVSQVTWNATGVGVLVSPGAKNVDIASNVFESPGAGAVLAAGVTGLDVTGNTIQRSCGGAVAVTASSTGVGIENNVLEDADPTINNGFDGGKAQCIADSAGWAPDITVDATTATGTTSDYNDFYSYGTDGTAPYSWAGTSYATLASFQSSVAQGAHDTNDTKEFTDIITTPTGGTPYVAAMPVAGSAALDSANQSAPGALTTDAFNHSPYNDRGAVEMSTAPYAWLNVLQTSTYGFFADASLSGAQNGATIVQYSYNWGDGSVPTTSPANSASHTYTQLGMYTVTLTVTDSLGQSTTTRVVIAAATYTNPDNLNAVLNLSQNSALSVSASDASSTVSTGNTIGRSNYVWGDGTQTGVDFAYSETHKYAKAGTYTVTVILTDQNGLSAAASVQVTTEGSDYTPYGPVRLLDTRVGIGAPAAKVQPQSSARIKIAGNGALPADVTAVVLNITVTDTTGSGFITAFGEGGAIPITSNLNYVAGQTVPNMAIATVGGDGYVDLFDGGGAAGSVDLIADVTGYFTHTAGSGYSSLNPDRLVDTRNGTGAPKAQVQATGTIRVQIAGADGGALPATGISAVALNMTVTDTGGSGFLTAYPDGQAVPNASNVNYTFGQTVANSVVVPVAADGKIDVTNGGAAAHGTDIVVDVVGYYSQNSVSAYQPVTPFRYLDTRNGTGITKGPVPNGAYIWMPLGYGVTAQNQPVQLPDVTGFVLNATVTDTAGNGFLAVSPDPNTYFQYQPGGGATQPGTPNSSTLNWVKGETVPNLVQASTGNTGVIDAWNLGAPGGNADMIVDIFGYYQND